MGEIRRFKFRYCLDCEREIRPACKAAGHPTERRERPTYWIRYYRNGVRIEESAETSSYEKARDLLRTREGAIAKGKPVTAESVRMKFDDAIKDVSADYTLNAKSSKPELERRITLHLTPYFGGRKLSSISTADLRAFTAKRLEAKASPGEINRELAIIRRAFRLAVKAERYYGRVPSFEMLDERDRVRTGFFDDKSIATVIANLKPAFHPVVRFAYVTGWRVQSEVLPLEWRQVDRDAKTVTLDPGTTKNKKGRVLDYSDHRELCDVLATLWAEHEAMPNKGLACPWVFHRNGKRIKTFRKSWATACEAAGLPGRILHDLRRSAVRNLVRAGVPDTVAMKITGHKTRSVFDRYDITSGADVREGLARLTQAPSVASVERASKQKKSFA
jgi:integrase